MRTTHEDSPEQEATVHYLHAVREDTTDQHQSEPEEDDGVVDGQLLSEAEYEELRRLTDPKLAALDRYQGYKNDLVRAGRGAAIAGRFAKPHLQTVGRHGSYLLGGTWEITCRAARRMTHGDLTEAVRQARAAGDYGQVAYLEQQKREAANSRWSRINLQLKVVAKLTVGAAGTFVVASAVALIYAVGAWLVPGGEDFASVWTDGYWATVEALASWIATLASWWPAAAIALAVGIGSIAYRIGQQAETAPAWLQAEEASRKDVIPDEGAILSALRNLGLPAMNRALKEGWTPRWVQGTGRDGKGWRTQLELPQGVTVEMINDKKSVLAHNLVRLPSEVWPTQPRDKPGVMDLWVAQQGVLQSKVDPWPLLESGTTDYFKGVPVGTDLRGDQVTGALMAANYIVGGTMGSGKSSLIINLLLGAMLDPLVELDVHVMAYNTDYDALRPRLNSLIKGDEDEQIEQALDMLADLRHQVTERGKLLEDLGGEETKLTREIAKSDARMRPRVIVVDECQELFEHPKHGQAAIELAAKAQKKARKTGQTLIWATPSPSAASLPRDLAKTASHRVCFAIGDHQGSDAVLGTGKHSQGITATGLVPGEDVGTAMASGFRREAGVLRCHHVRKDKDTDQQTPVVARAVAGREKAGITSTPAAITEKPDPLADIAEVLDGQPRVRTQEVLQRLANHNPSTYRSWTFNQLTDVLTDANAAPYKSGGHMVVSGQAVREAITARNNQGDSETDDN